LKPTTTSSLPDIYSFGFFSFRLTRNGIFSAALSGSKGIPTALESSLPFKNAETALRKFSDYNKKAVYNFK
jgi:hypothetical protein